MKKLSEMELQTAGVKENWNWVLVVVTLCGLTAKLLGPTKLRANCRIAE
jgi:hypothetical protein